MLHCLAYATLSFLFFSQFVYHISYLSHHAHTLFFLLSFLFSPSIGSVTSRRSLYVPSPRSSVFVASLSLIRWHHPSTIHHRFHKFFSLFWLFVFVVIWYLFGIWSIRHSLFYFSPPLPSFVLFVFLFFVSFFTTNINFPHPKFETISIFNTYIYIYSVHTYPLYHTLAYCKCTPWHHSTLTVLVMYFIITAFRSGLASLIISHNGIKASYNFKTKTWNNRDDSKTILLIQEQRHREQRPSQLIGKIFPKAVI